MICFCFFWFVCLPYDRISFVCPLSSWYTDLLFRSSLLNSLFVSLVSEHLMALLSWFLVSLCSLMQLYMCSNGSRKDYWLSVKNKTALPIRINQKEEHRHLLAPYPPGSASDVCSIVHVFSVFICSLPPYIRFVIIPFFSITWSQLISITCYPFIVIIL